jgi:hypothetical protein
MTKVSHGPEHYRENYAASTKDAGLVWAQYRICPVDKPALDALAKPFKDKATEVFRETQARKREERARRAEAARQRGFGRTISENEGIFHDTDGD